MRSYHLNQAGQSALRSIVSELHPNARRDAYFSEAEAEADVFGDGQDATIEVSPRDSVDGRPHVIELDRAWFDVRETTE